MKVRSARTPGIAGALGAAVILAIAACAQESSRVGAGGECFLASDCQPGLVCVPQRSGARLCSADLTGFEGNPPAEAGMADSGRVDAPADAPNQDTSVIDTGADTSIADSGADG